MEKKIQKLEKLLNDTSNHRLKSLKMPRDLSLGGVKKTQKVYHPNLNVVRRKCLNKPKNEETHVNTEKTEQIKTEPAENIVETKPQYIQTVGIFSEGLPSGRSPKKHTETKLKTKENALHKKNKSKVKKIEKIPEVVKEHHKNDIFNLNNATTNEDEESPAPIFWNPTKQQIETEDVLTYSEFLENNTKTPKLHLWNLPDSFGFLKTNSKSDCCLTDLPEGKIGKICVRKSGKTDIYIGNIVYELTGDFCNNEQLVCLNVDSGVKDAALLGNIEGRYSLLPDWGFMLA